MAVLAAIALHASALPAHAETPAELTKYAGEYKYDGTKDQYMAIVDKSLDEALSEQNMVMRLMIKKAIQESAASFIDKILIDLPGNKIGIKSGELQKVTVEIGKTDTITSQDGKGTAKATHKFEGGKIIQIMASERGSMTNVYQLSADGKSLTRTFTMTGERLSKPIKMVHKYIRK